MNEQEFLQRFEHKIFNYQVRLSNCNWVIVGMLPGGYLATTFERDHTLKFPDSIGFFPDERYWEFDEQKQMIILKNQDKSKIVAKYLLPKNSDGYSFILTNADDVNQRYITHLNFDFNVKVSPYSTLDKQQVIFLKNNITDDATKANLEMYAVKECCDIRYLDVSNDEWDFIDAAWNAITEGNELKQVCVFFTGIPDMTKPVLTDKLTLQSQDDNTKFVSGTKGDVDVVLSQLLIMHYHEQIMETDELHSPVELLDQVITN
ncbi:hypothetical protein OZX69_03625 [Lactobacillus sp. ESL0731]|uniref:hypothetical protein n=1 Tax=unclassified Lactobacillus TaxID=2620435 RepID=UPI0023F79783|nr:MULTISPECIES: hypothetical protein [unclassified Lactobacillus]WEV51799.1 hypothetical protein OZX63_03625 [Lactobacillus sp. ESL0700]WEV62928.1 hypothetical protein OZX69_03625 [Lactobacillus sp. ESL0731]